ncbi:uncharacterized protein PHACADRAFT_191842 [Phanerochaete carnosa HHB-10118-sp]|uniref:Uncharacterized protein n=1 Tax=Phanerochaete carnosa (strain HHB-10118-sp) TaxID=650164 RepID=K5W6D0_PHACS|nr:uncharacterized protein PHACADRAFT_191842 [Phanerochaete carnosa HHB-10118-sp]EKM59478.1 hypothetical protein PHACADRAFT_191842 [Phanerochaete carnosa HHB-10118-sp]
MVQVRQWELHQLEEKPLTHPTVRWVDMQEVIRGRQKTVRESTVSKDDSGDELYIDDEDDTEEVVVGVAPASYFIPIFSDLFHVCTTLQTSSAH